MNMNDLDVLDPTVRDAFERAHGDLRWAGNRWTDPLPRLRAGVRAQRLRLATMAAVASVAVAGGGVAAVHALRPSPDRLTFAGSGTGSGLDWLLTPAQYDAYQAAHPAPSAGPQQVTSPAPVDDAARRLQTDVTAAVGDATTLRLDAADGGAEGHAVLWLRVGSTPVAVERYRLDYPLVAGETARPTAGPDSRDSAEAFTAPRTWADGTAYTVATGQAMGYAFSRDEQWSGPVVWTVTPDGWLTSWTAPVTSDRLLGWAQTADEHYTGG